MFSSQPPMYTVVVTTKDIDVVVIGGGHGGVIEGFVMDREVSPVLVQEAALRSPTTSLVQRRCLIRRSVHCGVSCSFFNSV